MAKPNNYLKAFAWHHEPGERKARVQFFECFDDRSTRATHAAQKRLDAQIAMFVAVHERVNDPHPMYEKTGGYRPTFQVSVFKACADLPGIHEIGVFVPGNERVADKIEETEQCQ